MEPIFASESNHLARSTPAEPISMGGRHGLVPDIEPTTAGHSAERRAGLQDSQTSPQPPRRPFLAWETLEGIVVGLPVPAAAFGWKGQRFELLVGRVPMPILASTLVDAEGAPVTLSVGDTVTIEGYRVAHAGSRLMAVRIKVHAPAPRPVAQPPAGPRSSVGPYAEVANGLDSAYYTVYWV